MVSARVIRNIRVWVACVAILMGALAPTITHALNSMPGSAFLEVCTAIGSRLGWAGSGDGGAPASGVPADQMQHCPYCVLQAAAPALPPAPLQGLTLLPLAFQLPELFLAAPTTLHAWASIQARAPPRQA